MDKRYFPFTIYKSTHEILLEMHDKDGVPMIRLIHNAVEKLKKEMEGK